MSDIRDGEILADIKNVASKLGKSPTMKEYRNHGKFSTTLITTRFRTWNKAKKKADLDFESKDSKITKEEAIEELNKGKTIKEVAKEYGYSVKGNTAAHLSQKLRDMGIRTRSKLGKNKAAYKDGFSGILSVPKSMLQELDIPLNQDDDIYYTSEKTGPRQVTYTFATEKVYIEDDEE